MENWTDANTGELVHTNTMDQDNRSWGISNINWSMIYLALRTATNSTIQVIYGMKQFIGIHVQNIGYITS